MTLSHIEAAKHINPLIAISKVMSFERLLAVDYHCYAFTNDNEPMNIYQWPAINDIIVDHPSLNIMNHQQP